MKERNTWDTDYGGNSTSLFAFRKHFSIFFCSQNLNTLQLIFLMFIFFMYDRARAKYLPFWEQSWQTTTSYSTHVRWGEWNDLIITNVSWCLHAPSWGGESWESQEGCSVTQTAGSSQPSWLLWRDYLTTPIVLDHRVGRTVRSHVSCLSSFMLRNSSVSSHWMILNSRLCLVLTQWFQP